MKGIFDDKDKNLFPIGGFMPIDIPAVFRGVGKKLRDRMYRTVRPEEYSLEQVVNFIKGTPRQYYRNPNAEALLGKYTGQDSIIADYTQAPDYLTGGRYLTEEEKARLGVDRESSLKKYAVDDIIVPSKSKKGAFEFAYPNRLGNVPHLPTNANRVPDESWPHSHELGTFHQVKTNNDNGSSVTYEDIYDINPFRGKSSEDDSTWRGVIRIGKKIGLDKIGDIVPWGKPFEMHGQQSYDKEGYPKKAEGGFLQPRDAWDKLSMREKAEMMKVAVRNGIYNLNDIREKYNEFAEGGDTEEKDITPWKALDNIDYTAIPDTTFTRDKTGAGSIEVMFNNTPEEGYEYGTGYKYPHPLPGHNVVIYNPKDNDIQDIRLDALHIMPQDATYDALRSELAFYADNSDIANSARSKMKEDISKYGHVIPGMTYQDYFNNEVDGFLRNMFIEGSPEYIESKRYYPNKQQLREWNEHLMPYVDRIHNYLITGERPANILPEIIIYGKKHSIGGPLIEAANEYKHGGGIHIKPSHRGRLTELKKRTGKTEAELYRTGGPSVRKMITFARNARKWKHGLGGNLFVGGGDSNPMNYEIRGTIIDDDLKKQGITQVVDLPEVTVTGRDLTKPYYSSFDSSANPYIELFGALSKGFQPLSLSQQYGAVADAVQGKRNYFDSLFNGNSGFFTDEYAAEHPWVSTLGNMAGDIGLTYLSTKAISKLPTYMRLEKYYNGVPHRQSEINGKLQFDKIGNPIYMDENFPAVQKDVNVWGVNKADYARNYALDDGEIYKVYADPQELAANILETPIPNKGQYFDWQDLPFILDDQGVTLSKNMKEIAKTGKRSKYRTINEDYSKLYSPTERVSTDKVVEHSVKLGKKATRIHSVYDMPLTTFFGKNYSIPVEELVLHKNTNAYVLPHFMPKVKLLFDSQIPYSAKYLTNPFLPVTKYDDKD